ncbi:DUF5134 domain-containing protein [Pseudonocardia pini]|uniref:DUF5134 domain-containing protein n=1 Tax=Pseudonocardia pini TaxID=2758030 RepID=UPI0015F05F0C|nr:DUF5134 domain-containing protein [Pseudonocardia pini]
MPVGWFDAPAAAICLVAAAVLVVGAVRRRNPREIPEAVAEGTMAVGMAAMLVGADLVLWAAVVVHMVVAARLVLRRRGLSARGGAVLGAAALPVMAWMMAGSAAEVHPGHGAPGLLTSLLALFFAGSSLLRLAHVVDPGSDADPVLREGPGPDPARRQRAAAAVGPAAMAAMFLGAI